MLLLFIQKSAGRGGAKSRLLDTLATLKLNTNCVLHVITSECGEFTEHCASLGIPVTIHPLPEWRKWFQRLFFSSSINSIINQLPFDKADWVISNEMWWAPHASALAKKLGAKSASIIRDGIADRKKARKYTLQNNDLVLPVSIKIAAALRRDSKLALKTHVLLDAVILNQSKATSFKCLESSLSNVSASVKRWLLVIGKVQARKKQTDAVRVLRALIDKGCNDFGLILAGDCDPKYLLEMDDVISECNVNDRVVMLGNYSDISNLFALQPICLLTSLREALPGSVIESFLAGRPCFMYPCEGAEDIFGPHQHLFVCDDFEPSLLVNKMLPLLNNPSQMQYETDAVQKRAQNFFSSDAHFNSITSLLEINTTISCLKLL